MDTADRRPQLQALSYLDVDKAAKPEEDAQSSHKADSAVNPSAGPTPSPSAQHPPNQGPPQAYSRIQKPSAWSATGSTSPSEPRQGGGREEMDTVKQVMRQSLPSLNEALKMDRPVSFGSPSAGSQHKSHDSPVSFPRTDVPPSPPGRRYTSEAGPPPKPYSNGVGFPSSVYKDSYPPPSSFSSQEHYRPMYAPASETRSPVPSHASSQTGKPAHGPVSYATSQSGSQHESSPSLQSTTTMPPPSAPYGYSSYAPRYSQPSTPSSGPVYQPSTQFSAPPTSSPATWTSDGSRFGHEERSRPAYSESVKRHLEMYDFEAALLEISEASRIMMDFSRRYGEHIHQSARSGPSLGTLPSLVEIDDMMSKARVQHDSLAKIREVIVTQQAAYEQQLADQRAPPKPTFTDAHAPAPSVPLQQTPERPADSPEAGSGGFANGDNKKRRGRAAPPGRCHSCNRAETPEWRRGPDGARTLCNACGLHYAKLTRKQAGAANKAANLGSSNLRPKE